MSSSDGDPEQTETNFQNPREVFGQHGLRRKTLFQFLQRGYEARESKTSSRAIFPDFPFSFSVPILQELPRPAGDEFCETERGFCPETCPSTITSFSFHPGVIIEDKITSERTPVSQKNGPFLITENSEFGGSGGYSWPRRLNRLSELGEEIYLIY
jgi:hypothetical protein